MYQQEFLDIRYCFLFCTTILHSKVNNYGSAAIATGHNDDGLRIPGQSLIFFTAEACALLLGQFFSDSRFLDF